MHGLDHIYVSIEIDLQRRSGPAGAAEIAASAGPHYLGTWPVSVDPGWQTLTIESGEWPTDASLKLEVPGQEATDRRVEILFDQARFSWD